MKNALRHSIALLAVFTLAGSANAHDGQHPDAPNPSPNATVSEAVGFGDVSIEYGRPGVKGRTGEIWGKLVPYDNGAPVPWMAGANGNSVVTFSEDVKINGQSLAAGSYGLLMIPADGEWTIIFSSNASRRGIMNYTPHEDVLRIEASPREGEFREWLSYEFNKTGELTSDLNLHWENLVVGFSVEAPDHRTAEAASE